MRVKRQIQSLLLLCVVPLLLGACSKGIPGNAETVGGGGTWENVRKILFDRVAQIGADPTYARYLGRYAKGCASRHLGSYCEDFRSLAGNSALVERIQSLVLSETNAFSTLLAGPRPIPIVDLTGPLFSFSSSGQQFEKEAIVERNGDQLRIILDSALLDAPVSRTLFLVGHELFHAADGHNDDEFHPGYEDRTADFYYDWGGKALSLFDPNALIDNGIDIFTVAKTDLQLGNCDLTAPYSKACRGAADLKCRNHPAEQYAGGYGFWEVKASTVDMACVHKSAGAALAFSPEGNCTTANPSALYCDSVSRNKCIAAGYVSSTGVIDIAGAQLRTVCLGRQIEKQEIVRFSITKFLEERQDPACDRNSLLERNGCQADLLTFCRRQGYLLGFEMLEGSESIDAGFVLCTGGRFQ